MIILAKSIILHGGAGAWSLSTPERRALAKEVMYKCTEKGWRILIEKNNAVEAVVEAIKCMEDSGVLNAGWGSVLDLFGGRGLDAGIMASNGLLGAVANVSATRNAIELARIVAEETPHIILSGRGADELARAKGLPPLPPPPQRIIDIYKKYLVKLVKKESTRPYIEELYKFFDKNSEYYELVKEIVGVYDTVGACAVDDSGLLVAGVSTGGLLLKLPGRIGDSAVPGAGFYASDRIACSATGIGEKIIMSMPCQRLGFEARENSLEQASNNVLKYVNNKVGIDSLGFIAVDRDGNVTWKYNTEAILIGYVRENKVKVVLAGLKEE